MNNKTTDLAKDIVKSNIYMTLATSSQDGPWAAPVFYCLDDDLNFYFISQMESQHIQDILKDPKISIAIFDSTAEEGQGKGIQAIGHVEMIEGIDAIARALEIYKTSFISLTPEMLSGDSGYKIFSLKLDKVYVTDTEAEVDARIEVNLR